jgi:polyphosphate kinase 2 (PPK2 family)
MIQIFNRSHYEDVLIQRVRKWIDMDRVKRRYEYINFFEKILTENKTTILKFYLHVSQKEQLKSLMDRLEDPRKKWKYNAADIQERELWTEYMTAYEDVFKYCSPDIPWHIVPCDQNWYKEYYIAKTLVETMESFNMKYPDLNS